MIIDSYSETNQNAYLQSNQASEVGQAFTSTPATLTSSKFYLRKINSPTGDMISHLYNITGTYGTDAKPTGSALISSTAIDASTLTTSFALVEFTFSAYSLSAGYYAITLAYTDAGDTNRIYYGIDTTTPTHDGNICYKVGANWTGTNIYDDCFYVYGNIATNDNSMMFGINI